MRRQFLANLIICCVCQLIPLQTFNLGKFFNYGHSFGSATFTQIPEIKENNRWKSVNSFDHLLLLQNSGCRGLPLPLTEKANDLFESQLTAPGCKAWIGEKENPQLTSQTRCALGESGRDGTVATRSSRQPPTFTKHHEKKVPFSAVNASGGAWLIFRTELGVLMS